MEFASKSENSKCLVCFYTGLNHSNIKFTHSGEQSAEIFLRTHNCIAAYLAEKFSAFCGKLIVNAVFAPTQPQPLEYVWENLDSHSDADKESRCLDMRPCRFVHRYELFACVFLRSSWWRSTEMSAQSHISSDWNLSINWIVCIFTWVCCSFPPI
jgi:hypothetical protein